jgi:FtsP/CotA-like multicopper oxidase with cupredoxin domain
MKSNKTSLGSALSNNRHLFSRREFLAGLMAITGGSAAITLMGSFEKVSAQGTLAATTLPIPPLLRPQDQNGTRVFNLTLQQGQSHFLPGLTTATLGINGNYLGPTLRASQGDPVIMNVTNQIGEATTIHWHGMHLPAAMDGGPYQVIANNTQWNPHWTIMQPAATLWYHPHMMGQTREQVLRGLVGLFIIDDNNPAGAALPHTYGVDDIPLILQDESFAADGRLLIGGGGGGGRNNGQNGQTLVNGAITPLLTTSQTQLRFRLLNASDQSFYTIGFDDNREFYQVGSDGGLLPAAVSLTRLEIAPAERVEIVVNVTSASVFTLQRFANRDGNNGNGRGTTTLLTIKPTASAAAVPLPATLNNIERLLASSAAVTRDMVMAGGRGGFTINGQSMTTASMDNMSNMFQVRLGDTEIWNLINRSGNTHTFHVHDVQFQILDRTSGALAGSELGLKDTIMVRPGETARIIMRFTDFADAMMPYMFHCHILDHEDEGMMGQFVVVPA